MDCKYIKADTVLPYSSALNDPLGFSDLLMATVYGDIWWVSTECVVVSEKVVCMYFYNVESTSHVIKL